MSQTVYFNDIEDYTKSLISKYKFYMTSATEKGYSITTDIPENLLTQKTTHENEAESEIFFTPIYDSSGSNLTSDVNQDYHDLAFKEEINHLIETIESEIGDETDEQDTLILLVDIIIKHGKYFVQYMISFINERKVDFNTASELLLKLGIINRKLKDIDIAWFLHWCLFCEDSRLRYGALLGISYVRAPNSLPYLETALRNEDVEVLKKDLKRLIDKIKSE